MSEALRIALLAAADALEASREELSRLDAHAGDGDHGVTMTLAARAVRQRVTAAPRDIPDADLIGSVGQAIASVGGAIGPLYAAALMRVAAVVRKFESDPSSMSVVLCLRRCGEEANASVTEFGRAKPGDKTVVDALQPAAQALRQADREGWQPRDAIAHAARSARAGAESTTDMVATVGRASRLGERSRGAPDPGATSFAIILEAIAAAFPIASAAVGEGGVPRA